jgi:chemotaxis protein CheX
MDKVELAKPFIDATYDMLSLELGLDVNKGPMSETSKQGTSQEVNILIGVTGDLNGTVIYAMSAPTAKAIAGAMLLQEIEALERNAQSALCELGNMTTGMATSRLDSSISNVALTPPSIVVGKDIFISVLKLGCVQMQLITKAGSIDITVALEQRMVKSEALAS